MTRRNPFTNNIQIVLYFKKNNQKIMFGNTKYCWRKGSVMNVVINNSGPKIDPCGMMMNRH